MVHKTSCEECRKDYEEDERQPPCEEKGNCPINAIDLMPENQEALDLYQKIKAFGSDLTFILLDLKLTKFEAEELMYKLSSIDNTISEFRNSEERE